jgi:hypothetical protein
MNKFLATIKPISAQLFAGSQFPLKVSEPDSSWKYGKITRHGWPGN